jgi:hypothetical protein
MLIARYADDIEADFLMYYHGVDILDIFTKKMSLRKAAVLIERLPQESATMTALRRDAPDPDAGEMVDPRAPIKAPWSAEEMLVAQVIDEIRHLRYSVDTFAAGKDAGKVPVPENVVRPGVEPKQSSKRQKTLTQEQRRALDPRLRPGSGFSFTDGGASA